MEPLEVFSVTSPDEYGAMKYKEIISDALSDMNVNRAVGRLRVHIEPGEPVFIMCAIFRKTLPPIKVSDFAEIAPNLRKDDVVNIEIDAETHVSMLLQMLAERYGRGNIAQPERKIIQISTTDVVTESEVIQNLTILEPKKDINERFLAALARIIPEGFKVNYHITAETEQGEEFMYVASEEPIHPTHEGGWVDQAIVLMKELREMEV